MSAATLRWLEGDDRYIDLPARRVEIDCPHATTGVSRVGDDSVVSDEDAIRLALLRHHIGEECRCIRKLWRQYFGCPWPEISLVVGRDAA